MLLLGSLREGLGHKRNSVLAPVSLGLAILNHSKKVLRILPLETDNSQYKGHGSSTEPDFFSVPTQFPAAKRFHSAEMWSLTLGDEEMDIPFMYLCDPSVTHMKPQRETKWTRSSHFIRREDPELWWGSVLCSGIGWGQEHMQESGMEEMAVSAPSQHLICHFLKFYWWQIEWTKVSNSSGTG